MSTLVTIVFLILLNGFFALSEMAIVSSRRPILKDMLKKGNKNAQRVLDIIDDESRFLSSVQVGITAVAMLAAAYGGATIARNFGEVISKIPYIGIYGESIALTIVVIFLTYFSVVIGELIPKRIALKNPEMISIFIARPMIAFSKLFSPVVNLLDFSANAVLRFFGVSTASKSNDTEEELKAIINEGVQTGDIEKSEHEMMHRIFRLDDRDAKSIMTHASDIVFLDISDNQDQIKKKLTEANHSRYPVFDQDGNKVLGIVQAKDLFTQYMLTDQVDITLHMKPAHFISENTNCLKVLEMFKSSSIKLAIVVDDDRSNKNNFVSFWDTSTVTSPTLSGETLVQSSPNMWGRIEGEIPSEFDNNADYLFDKASLFYDSADATLDALIQAWDTTIAIAENVAAATAFAPCVGPIPCVVGPPPSWIVSTKAKLVAEGVKSIAVIANGAIVIKQRIDFDNNKDKYQGVTYASGAGDYAEYLLRENIGEEMTYGDIIGIKGGKISKNLIGAERIMVVSYKPIVLGNMPQKNKKDQYEKVAFMGQVPVKVYGKTNIGDYIIPSGKNDGIGIAIAPENIKTNQIKDIVGTAWAENNDGFNLINVAVGINRNDNNFILENLENKVNEQAKEISYLKSQIENILNSLKQGTTVAHKEEVVTNTKLNYQDYTSSKISVVESPEYDIIYLEITKQDLEEGIVLAEKMMKESGDYELNKEIFERLRNDSEFKENFISEIQRKLDKQIHYHKEIDKKGRH